MMNKNKFGGLWLGMTLVTGMMVGGCGTGSATSTDSTAGSSATTTTSTAAVTQDSTSMVADAVSTTSDASDAAEVANLMRGLDALRSDAVEGFHCDAKPVITNTTVCGKSLPSKVHLEWTTCAAPSKPEDSGKDSGGKDSGGKDSGGKDSGGKGGGGSQTPPSGGGSGSQTPPSGGGSGSQTPPSGGGSGSQTPPSGGGSGSQTPPSGGGSGSQTPPSGGGSGSQTPPSGGGSGPGVGPSTGTVDIAFTYTAAADCSGSITQDQSVTFQISRTDEDGAVSTQQGTTSSSAVLVAGAPPQKKATAADVTRTLTDKAGTVVKSVHLKGSTSVDFSSDTPPVRTLNGGYSEEFLDGSKGTVTLTNIVRPSRDVCPWPTAGSLTRVAADNTSHTLAFGPDCGAATLDGTAVDLSAQRMPEPGKH